MLIYGNGCKSIILKPIYQQVLRTSTYAFRTTPISNILTEIGLPAYELKPTIRPKFLNTNQSLLGEDVK